MFSEIKPPILFSPLKHHLGFVSSYAKRYSEIFAGSVPDERVIREIKHIGGSVTDIYTGALSINEITAQILDLLNELSIAGKKEFVKWCGEECTSFKCMTLNDNSEWVIKFHDNESRWIHIFPARNSSHTFRVKANTLKTAVSYVIISNNSVVNDEKIDTAREIAGLSPVKDILDIAAITELIDLIRG